MTLLAKMIMTASATLATTYGWGEVNCGDPGHAVPCTKGAITATGDTFDPTKATAALAFPLDKPLTPVFVWLRIKGGPCKRIKVNDKMHERYIGHRGFDLTPASVALLTGKAASATWSERVYVCSIERAGVDPIWQQMADLRAQR